MNIIYLAQIKKMDCDINVKTAALYCTIQCVLRIANIPSLPLQ